MPILLPKNRPKKYGATATTLVCMVKLRYEHRSVDGAGLDPLEKEPFSTFWRMKYF
jgi:hypothetical protein